VKVELIGTAVKWMAAEQEVCISDDPKHPQGSDQNTSTGLEKVQK